jgi:tetratricopeptide (TPR) repeat protein
VAGSAPEASVVRRLGPLVLADGSAEERLRAARLSEAVRAQDLAAALYRAVILAPPSLEERQREEGGPRVEALARLVALGEGDAVLWELLEQLDAGAPGTFVDALAAYARGRRGSERERALRVLAERVPERSGPLWQELFQRARDDNRLEDAVVALAGWTERTPEAAPRSALRTQLGDLYLHLGQPDRARAAYAQAAEEDPSQVAPLQKQLALTAPVEAPEEFVVLAERARALAGADSVAAVRPGLASAYARLGRTEDAYAILGELPATPERLVLRAGLADALGRLDEAFVLREQMVRSPTERARLGAEAARAGLLERAAQLLAGFERELPEELRREVAVLLAGSDTGAEVSVALWPLLLSTRSLDAEGWRAYAGALRRTGRPEVAARLEDFGRAAEGDLPLAELPAALAPVRRARNPRTRPLPPGAYPIDAAAMPRLHAALVHALAALGAPEVVVYLDPSGGPEAWMAGPETLVLGAGGLSHFGPAEVTFVLALALLLGDEGVELAMPGPLEALARVAPEAYAAVPAPLAAARVLVLLDPAVRGADVEGLDAVAVLAGSEGFAAVVQRALALV